MTPFNGGIIIYTTTETVPGKKIVSIIGIVTGNVVQSKHIGRDIMAGLNSIVGGDIVGYTQMLNEARDIAFERLVISANEKGADAVVGIRFTTSVIMEVVFKTMAFGTAVKLSSN